MRVAGDVLLFVVSGVLFAVCRLVRVVLPVVWCRLSAVVRCLFCAVRWVLFVSV